MTIPQVQESDFEIFAISAYRHTPPGNRTMPHGRALMPLFAWESASVVSIDGDQAGPEPR